MILRQKRVIKQTNKLSEQTVWFVPSMSPQPDMHILTLFIADSDYLLSIGTDTSDCHVFARMRVE